MESSVLISILDFFSRYDCEFGQLLQKNIEYFRINNVIFY